MEAPFPPFEPEELPPSQRTRLRDIPLRTLFPNILTLLAICSGLTSIRFAIEGRIELSIAAILLAAVLDGIDGRVARFLKSTTRFGAQMDSLADFVNFGVAPPMLLYFLFLDSVKPLGWIAALVFSMCACLRLARFNVQLDMPNRPSWQNNFFVGVPAPAGALVVLLPVYFYLLGMEKTVFVNSVVTFYVIAIGFLLVSNIPTFSGKNIGRSIPREYAMPIILALVILVAVLLSYPWLTMVAMSIAYLAAIPFGYHRYNQLVELSRAAASQPVKQTSPGRKKSPSKASGKKPGSRKTGK